MGCGSCGTTENGLPKGCKNNGACGTSGCNKLEVFDWLANMETPAGQKPFHIMEVRFKNGRKDFYLNDTGLEVFQGEVVAVESSPGHDIGVVSLTGELVKLQMKKRGVDPSRPDLKKIYRKAKPADIEKWKAAQALEVQTMYRARTIAVEMKLEMKISDVEYQGDKTKATFYYTADGRVDFRELIKVLAEEFRVRIEMRQIGARQEASRLGGIGSCGRELCCSTWLTDFRSVSTSAARYQQLSLNPLKLAGQCGKLKCCLNYELDSYMDAIKDFPVVEGKLETHKGFAFHQKTDIFKRLMFYSYTDAPDVFIPLKVERVKEIIAMNKRGEKPEELADKFNPALPEPEDEPDYENVVGQDSLTRFDRKKGQNKKRRSGDRNKQAGGDRNNAQNKPAARREGEGQKPEGRRDERPRGPRNQNEPRQGGDRPKQENRQRPPRNENKPKPEGGEGNSNKGQSEGGNRNRNNNRPQGNRNNNRNRGPRNEGNKPGNNPPAQE